jgi:hypothetical protein
MSEQGTGYSEYVEAELAAEHARRDSVNERSSKTLTSAGALVTLTLAVFAVLLGKDFTLSGWAKSFVVAALAFLLVSAICSVVAGFPWTMTRTKYATLEAMLRKRWGDTEVTARGATAYANLQVIKSLRPGTDKKFKFLLAAGILQIFAIASLVAATICVASAKSKSPTAATTPQTQTPATNINLSVAVSVTVATQSPQPTDLPTSPTREGK